MSFRAISFDAVESAADEALEAFMQVRLGEIELYPEVSLTLARLGARYRLGLLSNGNTDPERCGLAGVLDLVGSMTHWRSAWRIAVTTHSEHPDAPRLAGPDDADDVGRLLHDFNTEFDTPSPGRAVLAERLGRHLAGDSMFAIVAGRPAFAVALVSVRPNVWYSGSVALLDELYVEPNRRNEGTGSAILSLLTGHSLGSGIDAIEINVDEGDVDAQRFYERHGFSSAEPDTDERAFYYFRELRPAD